MRELVFCETPADIADAAADLIYDSQSTAIAERGIFTIALSGGNTPRLLYQALAAEEWRHRMAWEKWEVFWSDERAVPPGHKDSNFHLAFETLLHFVPIGEIWRMHGDTENLRGSAQDYARLLKSRCGPGLPELDVVLLGLGADGHTASLFPGHAALQSEQLVEAVEVAHAIPQRLTLTLPVLNRARAVIFLISGADKADTVQHILADDAGQLPAARANPADGECYWLLDEAAASKIR